MKKAGIHDVSSTHFLRHSSGNLVRMSTDSLDLAQAMTGLKSRSTVERIYTKMSIRNQIKAAKELEKLIEIEVNVGF
ncbi:hypothetical protein N9N67_12640 [Bacteriovoracaceae bacterium]|nr:hypothetical protein [Bacteriovoracaceae bacterium]